MPDDLKRWGFRFDMITSKLGHEEGGACAHVFPIDEPNNDEEISDRLQTRDLGRRFGVRLEEPVPGYLLLLSGDERKLSEILVMAGMREYV